MKRSGNRVTYLALLLLAASLILSFWPLALAGLILLSLAGSMVASVLAGLALDLLYGTPAGILSLAHFPFLIVVLVCFAFRTLALRYVREQETFDRV